MSLSAVSAYQPSNALDTLVPVLPTENAVTAAELEKSNASGSGKHLSMFAEGDDEASFWDFLDVINPLQHIPIVNNLYREATGDKIGVAARLVGGALFSGGPIGFLTAAANCVLEESTGKDTGGHMLALFRDDDPTGAATGTALAAAEPKAETPPVVVAEKTAAPVEADKAQPMVLDLVGADAASAQKVAAVTDKTATTPPSPPAAAPQSPVQTAAAEAPAQRGMAIPGRGEGRFMPIPGRTIPLATKSPPPIGTSVSTTGYRSNAPIVGHRPEAQRTAAMVAAQQMTAAPAETSATPSTAQTPKSGDWFSSNMMQAMDRYEKGNQLNRPSQNTFTEVQ